MLEQNASAGKKHLNRRSFIKLALCSGALCLAPDPLWAAIRHRHVEHRSLSLYNPHTKEALRTVYWEEGNYVPQALAEINYILRDRLTGQEKPIDTRLLDLLYAIGTKLNTRGPFHVISGYRTPRTNALLRKRDKRAAKNSYHVKGKAVDIHVPGFKLSAIRRISSKLKSGGVGYYPRSGFVHVDVGPVRYWTIR